VSVAGPVRGAPGFVYGLSTLCSQVVHHRTPVAGVSRIPTGRQPLDFSDFCPPYPVFFVAQGKRLRGGRSTRGSAQVDKVYWPSGHGQSGPRQDKQLRFRARGADQSRRELLLGCWGPER